MRLLISLLALATALTTFTACAEDRPRRPESSSGDGGAGGGASSSGSSSGDGGAGGGAGGGASSSGSSSGGGDAGGSGGGDCSEGVGGALGCGGPAWPHWVPEASKTYTTTNDTVQDSATSLMWQRQVPAGKYDWQQAKDYCAALQLEGHCDWRLPSRFELVSILDYANDLPSIDTTAFPNTPVVWFWSSSAYAGSALHAWSVGFDGGSVTDDYKDLHFHVRCVR